MSELILYKDPSLQPTTAAGYAAAYPELAHFFKCNETSGTTITDSVGNLVLLAQQSIASDGLGIQWGTEAFSATLQSGTLKSPGTKTIVVMRFSYNETQTSNDEFGSISGTNSGFTNHIISSANVSSVQVGATQVDSSSVAGLDNATACYVTRADLGATSGLRNFEYNSDAGTWTALGSEISLTGIGDMPAITQAMVIGSPGINGALYAIQIWYFDTTPSDKEIELAARFCMDAGYGKVVWPGFRRA